MLHNLTIKKYNLPYIKQIIKLYQSVMADDEAGMHEK
jgi:hypothetical protein